jgi:hypothetical protein
MHDSLNSFGSYRSKASKVVGALHRGLLRDAIITGMVRKLPKQSALAMEVNVRVQVIQNGIIHSTIC